jgi:hypothetical protein
VALPPWPGRHIRADGKGVAPIRIKAPSSDSCSRRGTTTSRVWYAPLSFRIGVALSLLTMTALVYVSTRHRLGEPRHATAGELR